MTDEHEQDRDTFRTFVAGSRWRFARTYVESYPHEYTLRAWTNPDEFEAAILCIERWGRIESFWGVGPRSNARLPGDEKKLLAERIRTRMP